MAQLSPPVPMPYTRVTYKTGHNRVAYTYTLRAYRNSKGKPTSDVVAVGKRNPNTGMLIPNGKYHELFPSQEVTKEESKPTLLRSASYQATAHYFGSSWPLCYRFNRFNILALDCIRQYLRNSSDKVDDRRDTLDSLLYLGNSFSVH